MQEISIDSNMFDSIYVHTCVVTEKAIVRQQIHIGSGLFKASFELKQK